MTRHGAITAQM